jgi:acetyl-CoA carboxylase carboxyltransferase component
MSNQLDKVKELIELRAKARMGGGEKAIEKQHAQGKYTARERITMLLDEGSFEEFDEFIVTAQIAVDFSGNGAGRLAAAVGLHAVPVKRVIPDLRGIIEKTGLGGITRRRLDDVIQTFVVQIGAFDQIIQIHHISVVMFTVMKIQGFGGDMRFERGFFIRQCR